MSQARVRTIVERYTPGYLPSQDAERLAADIASALADERAAGREEAARVAERYRDTCLIDEAWNAADGIAADIRALTPAP